MQCRPNYFRKTLSRRRKPFNFSPIIILSMLLFIFFLKPELCSNLPRSWTPKQVPSRFWPTLHRCPALDFGPLYLYASFYFIFLFFIYFLLLGRSSSNSTQLRNPQLKRCVREGSFRKWVLPFFRSPINNSRFWAGEDFFSHILHNNKRCRLCCLRKMFWTL